MKLKSLSTALLLSFGLVTAAGSAQAVNYVEIDGTNVQFFYDADFWGTNTATVTGNSISFDLGSDYTSSAKVKASSANGSATQVLQDNATLGLVAVAKSGYQLQGYVNANMAGDYTLAAHGGYAVGNVAGYAYTGTFADGTFNIESYLNAYGTYNIVFSSGTASSGTLNNSSNTGFSGSVVSAVGLDIFLASAVQQNGPGQTSSAVTGASYDFVAVAAPVPEPETYAMLLAGLGLVGAIARRRKANV